MPDPVVHNATEALHRIGLTEAAIQAHVMLPDNVAHAAAAPIELRTPADGTDDPGNPPPPSGTLYKLDTAKLSTDLQYLLRPCLTGFCMQLRQNNQVVFTESWNWAKTQVDGVQYWTPDTKMHVASVSKLMTAMAVTKLLRDRNMSPDSLIWPFLPPYWTRGGGIEELTFRHLLTHTSGLYISGKDPGPSDYQFMKKEVAQGCDPTIHQYRNINFGLMRILLTTLDAPWLFPKELPNPTDAFWDLATIRYYADYVSKHVFAPAGVTSSFLHGGDDALAYLHPPGTTPGWNSGDLSTMSGCAAWHLSVNELSAIMAAFRRSNSIMDPAFAQQMLDRQFGLDLKEDTLLGRVYAKGGFWSTNNGSTVAAFVEQANVFFLPKNMELVILANSPFCKANTDFMGDVFNAIKNNIQSLLLSQTVSAATTTIAGHGSVSGAQGITRRVTATPVRVDGK